MAHNDYDRILRENIQEIFVHYVERLLGIEIAESKALASKITGTYESEVDHLVRATSRSGEEFLLHFEFQRNNDPTMLRRIKRYHGVLYHKYGLPIHHFVIYLGQQKATMQTKLDDHEVFKEFHLIELARQKLEDFLCAPNPEEVLLGILSDFGSQKVMDSIQRIIDALQVICPDEVQLKRYLKQLKILSRIRKLDQVVHEIIERMPLMLDIRDSFDFKEGKAEGKQEGKEEGRVEAYAELVVSGTISIEIAADKLGVGVGEMNQYIVNFQKKSGVN